jgi:uncharacterized protein YbgA (DUF1722 family)/uncharacterized protein YbbK (DUF523 family)
LAPPIRIGISACLLGQEVRFDGGHKRDAFLMDVLGKHVEWVPVCPEVEVGMGTPRETLRLLRDNGTTRMVTTRTGVDYTGPMNTWSKQRVAELARADLDGYVLKKDSPSCGMERVKIFAGSGPAVRNGRGLFASVLLAALPLLPVEEEGRLTDPSLRDNFIERVFAYRRLKDLFAGRWSTGSLVRFHTAHKMTLLARSTMAYRELGRLVADGAKRPRAEVRQAYERLFMKTLALPATVRRHTNVLMHMAGHLKTLLDETSRRELVECIEDYRTELVPLIVPLTLIRHHARVHDVKYLEGQTYLRPDSRELMLRNHG